VTAYRLPDDLAAELEVLGDQEPTRVMGNYVWVRHDQLGVVHLDRTRLAAVLPPEPTNDRAYALVTGVARYTEIFGRRDSEWWSTSEYQRVGLSWAQLHERGKVTVLVPDPADDAPELPLKLTDGPTGGWLATVQPSAAAPGKVFMEVESTDYTPATARGIAAAIWRAAREVEQP
jgi:hypothetical protein